MPKTLAPPRSTRISLNNSKSGLLPYAWFDGRVAGLADAVLSIASSPVLCGLCVYSVFSLRVDKQEVRQAFRLKDHYRRLLNSCRLMQFAPPPELDSCEVFLKNIGQLIEANQPAHDTLVRVMVYVDSVNTGTRMSGLPTSYCAYQYQAVHILPPDGCHVMVSSWRRTDDNMIPSRAKVNGGYVNAALAKNEAMLAGFDDCILLNHSGHVAESSVANLFIVRDEILITPDVGSDILEGITRRTILTLAQRAGLKTEERAIDRSELYAADEMFLCGTSVRVTPVLSVDHRPIGDGNVGPITKGLAQVYVRSQTTPNDWTTEF